MLLMKPYTVLSVMLLALLLTACGNNTSKQEAEQLLSQANTLYEQGDYSQALAAIDSLRKVYPNAVDTRKKALTLYQNIELKQMKSCPKTFTSWPQWTVRCRP